ncbi:MAG: sugar ABC transporter ATP-binding protein [Spirochaetia bacterium]|nr:sugar ABC transporter ATP-binding protein [Spirochaetia bacterium]
MENILLSMKGISKSFPGVKALDKVDFSLNKGEIHALMGENGAGKSTLIKVLTGVHPFEEGTIHLEGHEGHLRNRSPEDAQRNGISTVFQEINLCPNLSVAENLFIGREPKKHGNIDWKAMNTRAKEVLLKMDMDIDVTLALENYSIAMQQMVAIARAVDMSAKVLILDEPTSSLDDQEVTKLFAIMKRLKEHGVGIIFVTHFLNQVYEICDRITVLRGGKLVGTYTVAELPRFQLVSKMMGKDLDELSDLRACGTNECKGDVLIETKGLGVSGSIKPFDIALHKGEVVGLAGLLGSGRSQLARAIYGADKPDKGKLFVRGKQFVAHSPLDSMRQGMAYLPEDRKEEGIIPDLSVRENIIIALQARKGFSKVISRKEQEDLCNKMIDLLQIKTPSTETTVKQLSGGNQQKVILARWLLTSPDFFILDEPTRGIDIGTKTEIQKLVIKLAKEGKSLMFISSEIDEMLRTCNRMAILRDGEKVSELQENELSQENIMATIASGGKK